MGLIKIQIKYFGRQKPNVWGRQKPNVGPGPQKPNEPGPQKPKDVSAEVVGKVIFHKGAAITAPLDSRGGGIELPPTSKIPPRATSAKNHHWNDIAAIHNLMWEIKTSITYK